MRIDPSGENFLVDIIRYIVGAFEGGNEADNKGGSWRAGFAYGLTHGDININFGGKYNDNNRSFSLDNYFSNPFASQTQEQSNTGSGNGLGVSYTWQDGNNSNINIDALPWVDEDGNPVNNNGVEQATLARCNFSQSMQLPGLGGDSYQIYNRRAAVEYARKWAKGRNPEYNLRTGLKSFLPWSDCANFASQVLYAGGIQQTNDWYFYTGHYDEGTPIRSRSWSVARDLATWLRKDSGIVENEILIPRGFNAGYISQISTQIKVGDLIGWSHDNNGSSIHHFGVITSLENGVIRYCGHTTNRIDEKLTMRTFEISDNSAVIFHIKDVVK